MTSQPTSPQTSHLTDTVPSTWDDARDGEFFRIVSDLFSPSFTAGAGVLLASYDSDDDETTSTTSAPQCPEARSALPATAAAV